MKTKYVVLLLCFCVSARATRDKTPLENPFHGMDLKDLQLAPRPAAPKNPAARPAKKTMAEEWDVSRKRFMEIMEAGGKNSLVLLLGKKKPRSPQEEAIFQTYNKLKAGSKKPDNNDRLAKELFYLHTMEIAASYEFLKPRFSHVIAKNLKASLKENLKKQIYDDALAELKKLNPNPTKAQLAELEKVATENAETKAPQFDKQMDEEAGRLADNYLMMMSRGITNPLEIDVEKVVRGFAERKDFLSYTRTPEILAVYVKPEHEFLKKNSWFFGKLFANPPDVSLTAAEKKLPKDQQTALMNNKMVERNTTLEKQRKALIQANFETFLKEDGLFSLDAD